MREFWRREGFIEIHSPKLMGTFSESGAEAFEVNYFHDRSAFLAQSPQFYKQTGDGGRLRAGLRDRPSFQSRTIVHNSSREALRAARRTKMGKAAACSNAEVRTTATSERSYNTPSRTLPANQATP